MFGRKRPGVPFCGCKDTLREIRKQIEIVLSDQPSMSEQQMALARIEELTRPYA